MHEALDNSISREVDEAVRLLKNSKAPGGNHALEGEVPKVWVDCTITSIYKKGSPNDPDNYCGIAPFVNRRQSVQ